MPFFRILPTHRDKPFHVQGPGGTKHEDQAVERLGGHCTVRTMTRTAGGFISRRGERTPAEGTVEALVPAL